MPLDNHCKTDHLCLMTLTWEISGVYESKMLKNAFFLGFFLYFHQVTLPPVGGPSALQN